MCGTGPVDPERCAPSTHSLVMCCRKLGGRDIRNLKPVDLMWYDVTGVEDGIEYQILEPSSEPNATHMKVGIALTAALEILTPFALARPTYCQAVPSVMERSKSFQVSLHKK